MKTQPGDAVIMTIRLVPAFERHFEKVEKEILSRYKARNSPLIHSNIKKVHVSSLYTVQCRKYIIITVRK